MFLVSVFDLTFKVEDALTALEMNGLTRDSIKAIPLESRNENRRMFDAANYSDNSSTLSLSFILAMLGTFFGVIFGFQLFWGPIMWAFIGAVSGFGIGLGISILVAFRKKKKQQNACKPNVVVIVQCSPDQVEKVKSILWTNAAIGVKSIE